MLLTLSDIDLAVDSLPAKQQEIYDLDFPGPGSFGVRLNPKGSKSFFLIYRLRGVRRRMNIGRFPHFTVEEARARALLILREVQFGGDPARETVAYELPLTFSEGVSRFMVDHVERRLVQKTIREYGRIFDRELLPPWSSLALSAVDERRISALLHTIRQDRQSEILAERVRSLLGKFFTFAVEARWVERNPVRELPPRLTSPKPVRVLTFVEIQHLLKLLGEDDTPMASVLLLVLYTGQLPGDVMTMRWSEISGDRWQVRGGREIPLIPAALKVLQQTERRSLGHEYVFPARSKGGAERPRTNLRREAAALSRRLKLIEPWTLRDLRRTLLLRMREIGIRPDIIERIRSRRDPVSKSPLYNHLPDLKTALTLWCERITPEAPKRPPGKLIEFTPRDS